MNTIYRLLNPASVAIIGASGDPGKTASRPLSYLRKHGYAGTIYPVNPRLNVIDGLQCYPDIASLPEVPEVGIVLLNTERAHVAIGELAARGVAASLVLASGYSETGEEGSAREVALAKAAGAMRLLGPNTIGLINLNDGIVLSASGALEFDRFPIGPISVVSQSGGILGALLSHAAARSIGLSKLISTGNEVDLGLEDFVEHLAADPSTQVIALYIEGLRNPKKFQSAALSAARAGKSIVAFKVGRSEAGKTAALSHTGALSGTDSAYDALFRQLGVIRAQTFSDLLNISAALSTGRILTGRRVAILTSTGGAGSLVADSLGRAGFDIPAPDTETRERLRSLHAEKEADLERNPIDVTLAGLKPDLLRGAIQCLLDSRSYDALVVIAGSSALAMPELMADAIRDCLPGKTKPVLAFVSPYAPNVVAKLTERGVPAFTTAEDCATALDGMLQSTDCRPSITTASPIGLAADADIQSGQLNEAQAKELFARFGVPSVREVVVSTPDEATAAARRFGSPVVLKILSDEIAHKSEIGGVDVNVAVEDVASRMADMSQRVKSHTGKMPERFLIQEMVSEGVELILGARRDPLGTVILLGMGGLGAELMNDTAVRLLPPSGELNSDDALTLAQELRVWPLLNGYRGRPKADLDALVSAIVSFSMMAGQFSQRLNQAEINPLFVLPTGKGVYAGDGLAVFDD